MHLQKVIHVVGRTQEYSCSHIYPLQTFSVTVKGEKLDEKTINVWECNIRVCSVLAILNLHMYCRVVGYSTAVRHMQLLIGCSLSIVSKCNSTSESWRPARHTGTRNALCEAILLDKKGQNISDYGMYSFQLRPIALHRLVLLTISENVF